jgi:hypothetical protein
MNDSNAQMHKTIRNVLSLRGGNSESSPECFLRCVSAMVAASIGAKAAVLVVLTVALVALVGSLTVNAIAGPSALEQRFTPRQLGLRTALMRKQRATQLWAVQDNGVRSSRDLKECRTMPACSLPEIGMVPHRSRQPSTRGVLQMGMGGSRTVPTLCMDPPGLR